MSRQLAERCPVVYASPEVIVAADADSQVLVGLIGAVVLTGGFMALAVAHRGALTARCDAIVAGEAVELRAARASQVVAWEVGAVLGGVAAGMALIVLPLLAASDHAPSAGPLFALVGTAALLGCPMLAVVAIRRWARPAQVRVDGVGLALEAPGVRFAMRWDEPFDLAVQTRRVYGKHPYDEVTWHVSLPDGRSAAFTHEVSRSHGWTPPEPEGADLPGVLEVSRSEAWHLGREGRAVLHVARRAWSRRRS